MNFSKGGNTLDSKRIKAIEILNAVEDYLYENKDKLFDKHVSSNKSIINEEGYYNLEDKIVEITTKD